MKLRGPRSERERRIRSVDVAGKPEDQPEMDFDPRRDFPSQELDRIKKLAGNINERTQQLHAPDSLKDAWWLSLVDPEFKELLYSDPEFKGALYAKFDGYYSHAAGDPRRSIEGTLFFAIPAVQLFPALREVLRKSRVDQLLSRLLRKETPAPKISDALYKLIPMLVLYPERREEWLSVYSLEKETFVGKLSTELKENYTPFVKARMVAEALLVFPELRSEILSAVQDREAWKSLFMQEEQPLRAGAYELGFHLTVVSAGSAWIDEQGQIQIELKPGNVNRTQSPLPERSTA